MLDILLIYATENKELFFQKGIINNNDKIVALELIKTINKFLKKYKIKCNINVNLNDKIVTFKTSLTLSDILLNLSRTDKYYSAIHYFGFFPNFEEENHHLSTYGEGEPSRLISEYCKPLEEDLVPFKKTVLKRRCESWKPYIIKIFKFLLIYFTKGH